jgi:hypothetical protein
VEDEAAAAATAALAIGQEEGNMPIAQGEAKVKVSIIGAWR